MVDESYDPFGEGPFLPADFTGVSLNYYPSERHRAAAQRAEVWRKRGDLWADEAVTIPYAPGFPSYLRRWVGGRPCFGNRLAPEDVRSWLADCYGDCDAETLEYLADVLHHARPQLDTHRRAADWLTARAVEVRALATTAGPSSTPPPGDGAATDIADRVAEKLLAEQRLRDVVKRAESILFKPRAAPTDPPPAPGTFAPTSPAAPAPDWPRINALARAVGLIDSAGDFCLPHKGKSALTGFAEALRARRYLTGSLADMEGLLGPRYGVEVHTQRPTKTRAAYYAATLAADAADKDAAAR